MKELKHIAYADDEPDIRTIVQIALEELGGFTLKLYESGSELLEKAPGSKPDMILIDVMMPGMDGIETFLSLRKIANMNDVPIVFLTAKAQTHEVKNYMVLGAADVIIKPFDPLALPDRMRSIWERSQTGGE